MTTDDVLAELVHRCRIRRSLLAAELRLSNQLDATERLQTGKFMAKRAGKTFVVSEGARAAAAETIPYLQPTLDELRRHRGALDKRIARLAAQLPVWPWVQDVRGAGALGLGLIVGAAGNLSDYATPAKLWKRMGLAVIQGQRQRRVAGDAALAEAHGYDARRRSLMWNVGNALMKQNRDGYKHLYDERKVYELARLPEATKGRKAHAHNRAKRYMEKRFLRDLWRAWRLDHAADVTQQRSVQSLGSAGA